MIEPLEKAKIVIRHKLSFNDLPPELTPEAVIELYCKLLASASLSDQHALIECHLRMAWKIANSMRKRLTVSKGLALDDLYQAGYLGLVQGVAWIVEGRTKGNEITPYLAVTCRRFISDHIEHDHAVPVERRALKKYYAEIGAPCISSIVDTNTYTPRIEAGLVIKETISMFPEREQRVIHMMLAGEDQKAMSEKLDVSQPAISQIIKALRERSVKLRIFGAWISVLLKEQDA